MAGWGLIAAALVFTVEIFISPGQTFNWYLFYLSTPFLLGIFLWKSSSPVKAIPLPIFIPLSMAGVGVMGFLQNQQPRDAMVQNMVFQFKIADDVALETLRVYFVVSVYLLVFALMTFRSQFLKITINNGFDIKEHQPDQAEQNKGYVWLSLLSVSLYIQQVGLRNLIYRDTYIDVNNHIQSRSLVNLLFVVQITLIGICAWKFDESVSSTRTLFRLILFGFVLEGFADGSRVGAIYILIWCFLTYVKNPKKIRAGILLLSFPTSILFCNLMVWFRSKPFHGLLPQLNYLRDFPWSSASEWYTTNVGSYSFNITAYAAYLAPKLPTSSFWVSVNPLPGFLTNWYEIAPSLRFNFYAPYTTIGELTNYGYLFLIAFSLPPFWEVLFLLSFS